ncbi:MAG: cell division ATP-binding protein FtsE [Alphaproteobacteria bacterium]|nr:cell division ATP-binding protein FtsE [Alphaproteobacteria bacterium]
MRDGDDDLIELRGASLRYGDGPEILKHVSFKMEQGDMRFLTGPSGAGKSSLLRMLFMALKPSQGLVSLFDRDIAQLPAWELPLLRRRIGVVFQDFRLLDHLTTFENVALPLRVIGQRPDQYRKDVMDLLDWVGLKSQAHAKPETLSGGEKQRAAIARAVVSKPEILLADEPTGNVDPVLAKRLLHLFVELNRLGTTVFLATHDLSLIKQTSGVLLRLEHGTLKSEAA